ncbi:MAG: beta-ketoacyl synthase N-terminal-like domain-containing protein, partial [Pedobacter sp.]
SGLAIEAELLAGLDPLFHLLLHAGKQAFDNGITEPLDRSRVGVIIGNLVLPSEKSSLLAQKWLGRTFEEKILGRSLDQPGVDPLNRYVAGLPAGLLARCLGLGGGGCTLDAACASSLYAIKLACDELLANRADAMLSGGLSRPDPLYTQMGFSQLRALSRRGICSPFDAAGDGLVVGEGTGIFLLKRTKDALAHGDHIHGIIRGIGLANDVGGSLLAPLSEGQLRAMHAAYAQAGWQPQDVDLIECHATGTPVGDATEFTSLRTLWGSSGPPGKQCVIGSVKSNIGHLLTAAGAAALTKVLLAIGEKTLPPTANFKNPPASIDLDNSPFRILTAETPWQRRGDGIPRRAAVSAFGFGGINAHLLIEEWLPETNTTLSRSSVTPTGKGTTIPKIAVVGMDAGFGPWQTLQAYQERVLGGDAITEATPPRNWWGARESAWFHKDGLDRIPFSGFYLDEFSVVAEQFRIPPREMEEMLPQQLLMLQTAARAMTDAGLDREGNLKTGVFIGIALDMGSANFSFRWSLAKKAADWNKELALGLSPEELAAWTHELRDAAGPPLTANRTMGALGSVVASRIAREFHVGGPSFTLSSEEGSGIRALETAVRLLQRGEIECALAGAVDLAGDLRAVLSHHATRPLSSSGKGTPFDEQADGSSIGEGAAAVVLKRLDDAQRDGDRIYAVIQGIGDAGGDMLLPGQTAYCRALERAYADAGVAPETISYLEANASGQPAEDAMESTALNGFFGSTPRQCAISSVKGDIGHCGAASGMAAFVRACLALYQEIIPACRGIESPLPALTGNSPFYLPRTPRYWLRNRANGPRRAGVSVCGIDGTCSHVVLEGWENSSQRAQTEQIAPTGPGSEFLFTLSAENPAELARGLEQLRRQSGQGKGGELAALSLQQHSREDTANPKTLAMALVARNLDELIALIDQCQEILASGQNANNAPLHPALRERLFYSHTPLGPDGKIAFVFPGSGNHYPGMGIELSSRWPEIYRNQDRANQYLLSQFQPNAFWNDAPMAMINDDHRAVIFGQVSTGCAVSDLVRSFGIKPQAVIGYSLGESAGLFALGAWRDRDEMLKRMNASTLFTHDMAGECRAARQAWGLGAGEDVDWSIGVLEAPGQAVRQALLAIPRVYLLIINTPDECVIGGDANNVNRLVTQLGCRFFPLDGVTTVHCEVARQVAKPYRNLHLFTTTPPPGVTFYSGALGAAYVLNRESAADSILAQAVEGIDFPAVINAAYADGVRYFLEMGPGSSCSRMISRILNGQPHMARSACYPGQDPTSAVLRMLAHLFAERIPIDLEPLFATPALHVATGKKDAARREPIRISVGGRPFQPALPLRQTSAIIPPPLADKTIPPQGAGNIETLIQEFAAARKAGIKAHETYLRVAEGLSRSMVENLGLQLSLREALGEGYGTKNLATATIQSAAAFNREMCLEFARGKVANMLGPAFAEADSYPTRVRLPDEPLMLVDRIVSLEGEAKSMTSGRVVTEHDIHANAWYLDGGRIPTCIAVEAGQADLFLSGYLGIDFITKGMAVYRLLDAVVTFHRELPGPGDTIRYDIHIERFFRQGETHLFRFHFEATVDGKPLLSMRDGCAGFFSAAELTAGKGIIRGALDLCPRTGNRPAHWQELTPMATEAYSSLQLDRLRAGDLAGCFGAAFAGLKLERPLTIPGGRMQLVHRVMEIAPQGGRYGLGLIRAEADIHPDDWFIACHFVDDRVMPGTLMYECCLHTLRIFLLRMGWVAEADNAAWEPVPGVASQLSCRGQVLETTRVVTYEVSIRELGYRPEPYALVDALMYADAKPIVEITNMSVRLTGTTRERLEALWIASPPTLLEECRVDVKKPAIYTKEQILAYSNGKPSEGFGEPYRIFDSGRKIARLPGPPFQFMDRVTALRGEPWQMVAGAMAEAQYDIPSDEWYFVADRQQRMPFAVLLEAALQPCGWLAAYVGSALTSPADISFRNLGGSAIQHRPVTPHSGTLTAAATMKKVATSGGMIIQEYDFSVADRQGILYEGDTMFGFFSREALANQVGVRDAVPYQPTADELARGRSLPFPEAPPFPDKMLRMIDRIELFIPDGGPENLGYIRGIKPVDPDEWFFKAHFYEDPVIPGSLGLESFLQLVRFAVVERWGWRK